jgi:magnesium transporter
MLAFTLRIMIRDLAVYRHGIRMDVPNLYAAWREVIEAGGFLWLGLVEPTAAELADAAQTLGLHPLSVEDAIHPHQRPKMERVDDHVVSVFKTVFYDDVASAIDTGEVVVITSPRFVVTVRHGLGAQLADTRTHLEADPKFLGLGPYSVLHAVLDKVVDDYLVIADELEQDIAAIERRVFSADAKSDAQDIYFLKREVIEFRRAVRPLRQELTLFDGEPAHGFVADLLPFFRDVQDHIARVSDLVEGFDELLTGVLQADLAQIQVRQNEDMRRITAWVAMAAVPTMVAGIYGMNFEHMPELRWHYAYPVVLGMLAATTGLMWRRFRRAGWL